MTFDKRPEGSVGCEGCRNTRPVQGEEISAVAEAGAGTISKEQQESQGAGPDLRGEIKVKCNIRELTARQVM